VYKKQYSLLLNPSSALGSDEATIIKT